MRRRVETAQRNGKEAEEGLTEWLEEAERRSRHAKELLSKEEVNCIGVSLRYKIGREASTMTRMIGGDVEKAGSFGLVFHRPILRSSFQNRDFEAFATTVRSREKIVEALRDADLEVVGVYGAGGIGKSTLVRDVARKVQEEGLFSEVVIVTVSQTYSIRNIQREIAEGLGLELREESELERAKRLKHRVGGARETRILVILDDLWEKLELSAIGICGKSASSCKILLVSRDRDVLWAHPDLDKDIEVNILSNEEAMHLFSKFVALPEHEALENSQFGRLATGIVAECGGLPIAVVTIASALRNKSVAVWEDALERLRESPEEGAFGAKVFMTVKTSYDYLVQEEKLVKPLLLLCSLHGEDKNISIDELMTYAVGWDVFPFVDTLEKARNRVGALIDRLKAHCLLLAGETNNYVKMHDVIRDVVLSIAAEHEHMYCFTNGAKLQYYLEKGKLSNSTAIAMNGLLFSPLTERFPCKRLQLLLMFGPINFDSSWDNQYKIIPENCFEETRELKVFKQDHLGSLPSSFSSLQNLQTLSLQYSRLEDIALIGELKSLMILNLSNSNLTQLPTTIGQLTRLRLLNLNYCNKLRKIPPNVIEKLVSLEELYMICGSVKWEIEGESASIVELKSLPRLRGLDLCLKDDCNLPNNAFGGDLERYSIRMGSWIATVPHQRSRILNLKLHENCLEHQHGLQMLMSKSDALFLHGTLRKADNIFPQMDTKGFRELKDLCIDSNNEIRHIVKSAPQIAQTSAFPILETLTLQNLRNLENLICHENKIESDVFGQLRSVRLQSCDSLKNIFSLVVPRKLEDICVEKCSKIEDIVIYHNSEAEGIELPHLKWLTLKDLPILIQFFRCESKATRASSSPNSFAPLFNRHVAFPGLTNLELVNINSSLLWEDQIGATSPMKNLTKLTVEKCHNLQYLFPVEVAEALIQLTDIDVKDCVKMVEVVRTTIKSPITLIFPKLETVKLTRLLSLKRFCVGDYIEFQSLWKLTLADCPILESFVGDSTLEPVNRVHEQPLFNEKLAFPCLNMVKVERCWSIKYLLSYATARSLLRLRILVIQECVTMEMVVKVHESDERSNDSFFSALEHLELSSLPSLRAVCLEDDCDYPSLLHLTIESCPQLPPFTLESGRWKREDSIVFSLPKLLGSRESGLKKIMGLVITDCNNLECLFTSAAVKSLTNLKWLTVERCENMEEVVDIKGRMSKSVSFPKLEYLGLFFLARLKRFCVADCIECPSLRKLTIIDCPEFNSFVLKNSTLGDGEREHEKFQPFFHEKVMFPELSKLVMRYCNGFEMWPRRCSTMHFPKLNSLELNCYRHNAVADLPKICPCHEIGWISLRGSFVKIAWPQQECNLIEHDDATAARLWTLELHGLPFLSYLLDHSESSEIVSTTETVENLVVERCSRLKTLTPSSFVSFQNLKDLSVWKCHRIRNLFTTSTARSLTRLTRVNIMECKELTEIVALEDNDDRETQQIVFERLKVLALHHLPSLEFFYGGVCGMEFPELEKLFVRECPEMKSFARGFVSAPKLDSIMTKSKFGFNGLDELERAKPSEQLCEGDLEASIRKLWEEDSGSALRWLFHAPDDQNTAECFDTSFEEEDNFFDNSGGCTIR